MNYRHHFHAGNFADLLKHAVLLELLADLTRSASPLTVIDTHAGAGVYDLSGDMAVRTGEGAAGIGRLMDEALPPAALARLKAEVARVNGAGQPLRLYPGSPLLTARTMRQRDSLIACEARADDAAALKQALPREAGAQVLKADGWASAVQRTPAPPARLLVLIDPPFEAASDYGQIVATTSRIMARNRSAVIAIWLPIKDLATYDAFLTGLEDAIGAAPALVTETRLRRPLDPMKMNGCAMAVVNPPPGLAAPAAAAADWIARTLGDADASSRAFAINAPASRLGDA